MTVYIGVDLHARQQSISDMNTDDGESKRRTLLHQPHDSRSLYQQFCGEVIIGVQACGDTQWFEELIAEIGHTRLVF